MTSYSRQKQLTSKIQKETIVGNTKFFYRAKFQLKRLQIEKLVWKRPLFDDSCMTCRELKVQEFFVDQLSLSVVFYTIEDY